MSVCTFIASDYPLHEVSPHKDYPLHVDIDKGTIYDGDADDNFFLHSFESVKSYTDKEYGVSLEWAYYTEGRARLILNYIHDILKHTDCVELWRVWLMDYFEFEDRPVIHKRTISFKDLTIDDIKEIDAAEVRNKPDQYLPERPTFYQLKIQR